jgi:hypothetical protein
MEGFGKHRVGCRKREKIKKVTSSQDDESVEGFGKHRVGCRKREKIKKVTSSQDDESVEGFGKHRVGCRKHEKIKKVTSSQDDDSVGVRRKKHPKQVSAYQTTSRVAFVPARQAQGSLCGTALQHMLN